VGVLKEETKPPGSYICYLGLLFYIHGRSERRKEECTITHSCATHAYTHTHTHIHTFDAKEIKINSAAKDNTAMETSVSGKYFCHQ
jgi:hypothetical protein